MERITVTCTNCGESWEIETPGFAEARAMLENVDFCPACEHTVEEEV